MKINIKTLEQLPDAAEQFLTAISESGEKIIAFSGEMGAGKTTFIGALLKAMGVEDKISSPTFSIVNEYHSKKYKTIYHFDFYRIENIEEAFDIGLDEYLDNTSYCFIEWPEKIENVLTNQCLWVNLSESQGIRTLEFEL